jgi:hypothetical protein
MAFWYSFQSGVFPQLEETPNNTAWLVCANFAERSRAEEVIDEADTYVAGTFATC